MEYKFGQLDTVPINKVSNHQNNNKHTMGEKKNEGN